MAEDRGTETFRDGKGWWLTVETCKDISILGLICIII